MFKDHLVTWMNEYLELEHGKHHAGEILIDIDCRYVIVIQPMQTHSDEHFILLGLQLCSLFLHCNDFQKAVGSNSGLGMILRH